ncbi:MAG: PhzF family phenazine biosynthesis protein, partial [Cocleimonas sp.]|nr:PhzF family phenazine biosynthesis protein [Cocleimonas sp.]
MMLKIFQVDAFADQLFTGNPAMVCLIETESGDYDSQWMQLLAAEMNLSETAFLIKKAEGHYHLRWFTPATEVKLCGHATLASAHVLWTEVGVPTD